MPHNASDPKQVKSKAEAATRERKQELEDIRYLIKTPAGLRYFRRLLARGSVFTTTFTGNSRTFFNEGARNLALSILADVSEAAPDMIAGLMVCVDTKEEEKQNARPSS